MRILGYVAVAVSIPFKGYLCTKADLVAASGGNIRAVIADGAYDGEPTYDAIRAARPPGSPPKIVIPPKAPSIPDKGDRHGGSERKRHAAEIARHGRMAWQRRHGYGKRSLVETAFSRIKTMNGGRLTSRTFGSQQNEITFTSRSPTETCSLRGRHQSASVEDVT